jgi:hypothetical protein
VVHFFFLSLQEVRKTFLQLVFDLVEFRINKLKIFLGLEFGSRLWPELTLRLTHCLALGVRRLSQLERAVLATGPGSAVKFFV